MQLMERRMHDSGAPICNVQHPPKSPTIHTCSEQFLQLFKNKGPPNIVGFLGTFKIQELVLQIWVGQHNQATSHPKLVNS